MEGSSKKEISLLNLERVCLCTMLDDRHVSVSLTSLSSLQEEII